MPPASGKDGNPVALGLVQGPAINGYWRNDRQAVIDQLLCESMFFKDLWSRPALRSIKLHDDRVRILDAHLVNPILIAIEGQQAEVTAQADRLDATDDAIRGQPVVGMGHDAPLSESAILPCVGSGGRASKRPNLY